MVYGWVALSEGRAKCVARLFLLSTLLDFIIVSSSYFSISPHVFLTSTQKMNFFPCIVHLPFVRIPKSSQEKKAGKTTAFL